MAIVSKGSSVKKNLKFFIYGEQGTWKSTLAMQLGALKREDGKPVRLLYVDAESHIPSNEKPSTISLQYAVSVGAFPLVFSE